MEEQEIKILLEIYQNSINDYERDMIYDKIYNQYKNLLKGFERSSKIHSEFERQDLRQELVLALVEAMTEFNVYLDSKFITFLYLLLKAGKRKWHKSLDLNRYKDKETDSDYVFEDMFEDISKDNYTEDIINIDYTHLFNRVMSFTSGFSPQDKQILELKMSGLKNHEIAVELKVLESTVKSRIQIIRQKLIDRFGRLGE